MTNIIINGCYGRLGRVIAECAASGDSVKVVAGIDIALPRAGTEIPFQVFGRLEDCDVPADVIIDCSFAGFVPNVVAYAKERKLPLVICTTGLSDETQAIVKEAAGEIGILQSANMSLGINLLAGLLKRAAKVLYDADFDIEIVEKHHNKKLDAPSGTALLLANAVNKGLDSELENVYDRTSVRRERGRNELGIHAVRGGTIVGEHSVIFAGRDEVIELTHSAGSKEIFAVGALKAAQFMKGKTHGLYDYETMLNELL